MKSTHCARDMPFVCKICHFRSSFKHHVVEHFKERHSGCNALQCPFCLDLYYCQARQVVTGVQGTTKFYSHLFKHMNNTPRYSTEGYDICIFIFIVDYKCLQIGWAWVEGLLTMSIIVLFITELVASVLYRSSNKKTYECIEKRATEKERLEKAKWLVVDGLARNLFLFISHGRNHNYLQLKVKWIYNLYMKVRLHVYIWMVLKRVVEDKVRRIFSLFLRRRNHGNGRWWEAGRSCELARSIAAATWRCWRFRLSRMPTAHNWGPFCESSSMHWMSFLHVLPEQFHGTHVENARATRSSCAEVHCLSASSR